MTAPAAWSLATPVLLLVVSAWVVGILYGAYLACKRFDRSYRSLMFGDSA